MKAKQRKSKAISLVLLSALPALPGCGGCSSPTPQRTEYVDEYEQPPDGPDIVVGPLFPAWWVLTHPPRRVARVVGPVSSTTSSAQHYSRSYGSGWYFFRPSSGYSSGSSSAFRPSTPSSTSSSISRGGFGSTGSSMSGSS